MCVCAAGSPTPILHTEDSQKSHGGEIEWLCSFFDENRSVCVCVCAAMGERNAPFVDVVKRH